MTTLIRNSILTAAVLVLPGCLAVNALLGVAGFLTTSPIQYAGVAYSVGEYAYEYAVNDKTPDEVIGEKFAWLSGQDEPSLEEGPVLALNESVEPEFVPVPLVPVPLATAPLRDVSPSSSKPEQPATLQPLMTASLETPSFRRSAPVDPERVTTPVASVKRVPLPQPKSVAPATVALAKPLVVPLPSVAPKHEYVVRRINPLQVRLDRMEHGLAQAEQLMNSKSVDGIRYSVQPQDSGQGGTSLSGSWSIRHPVLQEEPPAAMDAADEGVLVTAQL